MKRFIVVLLVLVVAGFGFAQTNTTLKGELNLFAWLPDNPDIVVNWVNAFQKMYPNVKVNSQMMTGNTLIENMQPRYAAKNMPDVFSNELDVFSHTTRKSSQFLGSVVMPAFLK